MGKVDDNKRQKRERLLNKAYELFTTKGFTNTSISDIVENMAHDKNVTTFTK